MVLRRKIPGTDRGGSDSATGAVMSLINWRARAMAVALLAWCAATDVAHAATYDEAILGDLSGTADAPTPWTLSAGANPLIGTAGTNALAGTADFDLVAIEIPVGHQLIRSRSSRT